MKSTKFTVIALLAILLSGCGLTPPKPATSEYFVSEGGGFIFDNKKREARYSLIVSSKENVIAGNYIQVSYQNHTGGQDLSSEHTVAVDENRFILQSPPVKGLKAHKLSRKY